MSPSIDPPRDAEPRLQFGIRSLLWLTLVIALLLVCLVQSQKLRSAQRALARTAWATGDVTIPAGKFRLLVNKIVDDNDVKVWVIRFEANEEHHVRAGGAESITTPAEDGASHWAEVKIVATYDSTARRLTSLTRAGSGTGWAGGKSVYTLAPDAKPKEFLKISVEPGLYDLTQQLELGSEDGKPINLSVR